MPELASVAVLTPTHRDAWVETARGVAPPGGDPRFLVYSVTKTFTAAAVLRLAARGEVIRPLRLRNTSVASDADLPRLAFGPSPYLGCGEAVAVAQRYRVGWVSHQVVASTAGDVAQFLEGLLGPHLLTARWRAELQRARQVSPAPLRRFQHPGYGLGLQVDLDPAHPVVGHSGGGPGATSAVYQRSGGKSPVTVAVLRAGESASAEDMALDLCTVATAAAR